MATCVLALGVSSDFSAVAAQLLSFKEEVDADVFTIGGLYGVTDQSTSG